MGAEGLNVDSTPDQPLTMSNGFHCSDLSVKNGQLDPTVGEVQKQGLAAFKVWLAEYDAGIVPPPTPSGPPALPSGPPGGHHGHGHHHGPGPASSKKPVNAWNKMFAED